MENENNNELQQNNQKTNKTSNIIQIKRNKNI